MIQKAIKLRENQAEPFTIAEMDANLKELDNRTKHSDQSLNSIKLLAERIARFGIFKPYLNIAEMLRKQSEHMENDFLQVKDALGDDRISFPDGALDRVAYYKFEGSGSRLISDYSIISVPGISAGLELGETITKAYRGDRGKYSYDSLKEAESFDYAGRFISNLNF